MPIYEYKCEKCGKVISAIQRIVEEPLRVHEGCGGELARLISGGRPPITAKKSERSFEEDFAGGMGGMEAMGGMDPMGAMGGMGDMMGAGDFGGMGGMDDMGGMEDMGEDFGNGMGGDDDFSAGG